MDNQKVEQVLKEIFERYGMEILYDRQRLEGSVLDLLDKSKYQNERIVFQHFFGSTALWPFVDAVSVTGDMAGKAVEQLEKENHMRKEDAEFLVRCVIRACGKESEGQSQNSEKKRLKKKAGWLKSKKQEKTKASRLKEEEGESGQFKEEEGKDGRLKEGEENEKTSSPSLKMPCKLQGYGCFWRRRGELCLELDKMTFTSFYGNKRVELFYRDMKKLRTFALDKWLWMILMAGFLSCLFFGGLGIAVVIFVGVLFILYEILVIWICNRSLSIVMARDRMGFKYYYSINFFEPLQKRQAVFIIQRGMGK